MLYLGALLLAGTYFEKRWGAYPEVFPFASNFNI